MRLIARLDVKPPFVVKPVHFEGLRRIGAPSALARKYYDQGVDEILYLDIVASLYQRQISFADIMQTTQDIFIPFSVGGGVRCLDDMIRLFHTGADKIVLNTFVLQQDPSLIDRAARMFGSQSVVVNIEAKRFRDVWECYTDGGRERTFRDALDWAKEAQDRGSGEIIIQSIDNDGRREGFDVDLISQLKQIVNIPVVAASGAGSIDHIVAMANNAKPDAVAIGSLLHYDLAVISDIKRRLESELK